MRVRFFPKVDLAALIFFVIGFSAPVFSGSLFDDLHQTNADLGITEASNSRSEGVGLSPFSSLEQNHFYSGNVLLAQATANLGKSSDPYFFSKNSYLAAAAIRTIKNNVKFLRKFKFFEIGNSLNFQKFAYSVSDVFPLEKYFGDRKNDTRAIAAFELSASGYKAYVYLKYYDAIDSKFEYRDLSQKEIDRDVWHELIHVYEFKNPELDKKYSKYNKSGVFNRDDIFTERHASFFDDLIQALGPLSERVGDGRGTLFSIKDTVIRLYELSKEEFWKDWSEADFRADLYTFHSHTGIKFDIERFRTIDEHTESLLYRKHWYDIGYVASEVHCSNFSRLADRFETSDIKTTLHTVALPITKIKFSTPEMEVYLTPEFREKIAREHPDVSTFCIARKMP